jgi:hypothetical protein
LSTGWLTGITFRVPYELSESPIAHEVRSQFDRISADRKSGLKTLLRDVTNNIYVPVAMMAVFVSVGIAEHKAKGEPFLSGVLLTLQALALLFFIAYTYFVWTKADRVNLYFKRPNEGERLARRNDWFEKLFLVVLGAILGLVGTLVAQHFKH